MVQYTILFLLAAAAGAGRRHSHRLLVEVVNYAYVDYSFASNNSREV